MGNKIYLIVAGEYSDWAIHGFFTNQDDAEKYCVYKNKEEDKDGYGEYYVIEVESLDGTTNITNLDFYYEYRVVFTRNGTLWDKKVRLVLNKCKPSAKEDGITTVYWCSKNRLDNEHIEKIACDLLAAYKAKKAGL